MFEFQRRLIASLLLAWMILTPHIALACEEKGNNSPIEFKEIRLSEKPDPLIAAGWGRRLVFTSKNVAKCTISYLKVAVISRNAKGQIIKLDDMQVFFSGSLPPGLKKDEEIIHRGFISSQDLTLIMEIKDVNISVIEFQFRETK